MLAALALVCASLTALPATDGGRFDPERGTAVLLFVLHECPIANKSLPEFSRIAVEYGKRGVAFRMVYVEPDMTLASARKHLADYRVPMPGLLDTRRAWVRHFGVKVSPEAVVLRSGKVVYQGRIDDRFPALGKPRPEPTRRDLRLALDAVLAGKPVAVPRTTPVGCVL